MSNTPWNTHKKSATLGQFYKVAFLQIIKSWLFQYVYTYEVCQMVFSGDRVHEKWHEKLKNLYYLLVAEIFSLCTEEMLMEWGLIIFKDFGVFRSVP